MLSVGIIKKINIQCHLSNMAVDVSQDIPIKNWKRLVLLLLECCNMFKKNVQDCRRNTRLCKL